MELIEITVDELKLLGNVEFMVYRASGKAYEHWRFEGTFSYWDAVEEKWRINFEPGSTYLTTHKLYLITEE